MLNPGIRGRAETAVTKENTALSMKSGDLEVFATPAMTALIEEAAVAALAPYLEAEMTTVGSKISVNHLAATPVGLSVTAEATLEEIDGRRLVFSAEVFDEAGKVGSAVHERVIVSRRKFTEKAGARSAKTLT